MSRLRPARTIFRPGVLVALVMAIPPACSATIGRADTFGDIDIAVQPEPAVEAGKLELRHGAYVEHRIAIRNRSKTKDHQVRLFHPVYSVGYYTDYLERSSRTVAVPHGASVVVSLFQPSLAVFDERMAVEIDGRRQEATVELSSPFSRGYDNHSGGRPPLTVLVSRGVPQDLKDKVRAANRDEVTFCRSELPVSDWRTHWLGYSSFDVVLLTEQDAQSLPADVTLALRRFAEVGGIVLVHATSTDPVQSIPVALRDADGVAERDGTYHVGFGIVRPCPTKGAWPSEFWVAKTKQIAAPKDRSVRVVSDLEVPVRGLLLLVICFAVGIGPVNVWLLSRRQKKMWLWWNVPAVSLATCLAVFGYSVASEGISGRGRSALMTLLDENSHRATTLGYISYYCPLTPSDGLHFSYDTEVSALVPDSGVGYPMYRSGRGKSVDWTSDQHFTSGWVVARVPAFFSVRKSEVRRERLAFRRGDDGTLRVVNGLGADIESLNYVDPQGNAYTASSIPAGQERALVAKPASATPNSSTSWSERGLFKQSWETSLVELQKQPERYLKPGRYVAVVGRSPFLENPLESASQDGSFGIIYGISSGAGDGR